MTQERAKANDIAHQETNGHNYQRQSQGDKELQRWGIIGSQLLSIKQQKAGKEEIMEQVYI